MNLLYNTLQEPTSITHMEKGFFIDKHTASLVAIRGSLLVDFYIQDKESGKLIKELCIKPFSQITQIASMKSIIAKKDLLIITSDSGNVTVIEF